MIEKHKSEAGRSLVVFLIQPLLISNRYNFLDFNSTAMKFRLISNISMLFQGPIFLFCFPLGHQKTKELADLVLGSPQLRVNTALFHSVPVLFRYG
jgi:hypothetical protein